MGLFKPKPTGAAGDPLVAIFAQTATRHGMNVTQLSAEGAVFEMQGLTSQISFNAMRVEFNARPPHERAAVVEHYVLGFLESAAGDHVQEGFDALKDRLLPRVSLPYDHPAPTPFYPIVENVLNAYIVVDSPRSVRFVTSDDAAGWGMTIDDLLPLALSNLLARSSPSKLRPFDPRFPGLLLYEPEDQFEAARMLLLPQLLRPWPARGAIVAAGSREMLLVAPFLGPDVIGVLNPMIELVDKIAQDSTHPVSDQLFWHDGEYWNHLRVLRSPGKIGLVPPDRFTWALAGLPREQWDTGPPGLKNGA